MVKSKLSVNYLAKVAILGALARIIMLFEFALPFFPAFLKFDFSDIIPLIGGLAMGPMAGVLIELVKCVLHLFQTTTGGVGDLANFIVGSAYVWVAAAYYHRDRTRKNAVIGLLLGTITMILTGALVNYFITIPLYGLVLGFTEEAIVGMGSALIPAIHNRLTLILFAFCPFNLIKGLVLTVIALPLYKKVSPLLQKGILK